MLRGISTSDWHLGGMKRVLPDPTSWILSEVEKPFAYALENGIDHVFIPGDISDTYKLDDHTFIQLVSLLLKYDGQLNMYYLRGNHDWHSTGKTSLDVLDFLVTSGFFKTLKLYSSSKTEIIDEVEVSFIPFTYRRVKRKLLPRLLFAHVESPGALGDNGRMLSTKEDQVDRVAGDFLISGHIHQYQDIPGKNTVYNGSLFQKNFGEALPKGFIEFQATQYADGLEVSHQFVNSRPNFKLRTITIRESADWSKIRDDETIRYKVLVDRSSGVIVPKDITRERPNIVYLNGTESLSKVEIDTSRTITSDSLQFNPVRGLGSYLARAGIEEDLIREARLEVKKAWKSLKP